MPEPTDIDALLSRYVDGQLTPDDTARLEAWLRASEANRRLFWDRTQQHALLGDVLQEEAGRRAATGSASNRPPPVTARRTRRHPRPSRPLAFRAGVGLALAALLLAGIGGVVLGNRSDPSASVGRLAAVLGECRLIRAGVESTAEPGTRLFSEDRLVVSGMATATIAYAGESTEVALSAGARIRLWQEADGKRIDLDAGVLTAEVAPQPAAMRIATRHGEATILGTRFVLTAEESVTTLVVSKGLVRLTNAGEAVEVAAGSTARSSSGHVPALVTAGPSALLPSDQGLVGRWTFDEPAGTTAADASGRNHVGTVLSEKPSWGPGRLGGALSFDGNNEAVQVRDAPDLRLEATFTITAWIRPETFGEKGYGRICFKGDRTGYDYDLYLNGEGARFGFSCQSGEYSSHPRAVHLGRWQHVAVVGDGQALRFYVDGVENQVVEVAVVLTPSERPLWIGREPLGQRTFAGAIDDLRIYRRPLSAEELAALAH